MGMGIKPSEKSTSKAVENNRKIKKAGERRSRRGMKKKGEARK